MLTLTTALLQFSPNLIPAAISKINVILNTITTVVITAGAEGADTITFSGTHTIRRSSSSLPCLFPAPSPVPHFTRPVYLAPEALWILKSVKRLSFDSICVTTRTSRTTVISTANARKPRQQSTVFCTNSSYCNRHPNNCTHRTDLLVLFSRPRLHLEAFHNIQMDSRWCKCGSRIMFDVERNMVMWSLWCVARPLVE